MASEQVARGLEGIVVAETAISDVRGNAGELVFRGRSIEHWVSMPFTDVAAAIIDCPTNLGDALLRWGALSKAETNLVLSLQGLHPMCMLQAIVPALGKLDADSAQGVSEQPVTEGLLVAAKLPQAIATHFAGGGVQYPLELDYIRRFMLQLPDANMDALEAVNITQVLQLEHSLNAGTFAARVVASTLASADASIAAAFGALSGVLHGGADQAAIEMADRIGDPKNAEQFVTDALAAKVKIMGMGHREYKVVDPRAHYVKRLACELSENTPHARTFATLNAVESAMTKAMAARGKPVHANLEFYKGLVYRCAGIPDRYFTSLFAMARVFGYIAHVAESRVDSRIIRPAARYVGN